MIAGICFSLTIAIGMVYEIYEFFGKVFFYTIDQGGYTNTVTDLISNAVGAAAGVAFAFYCDPLNAKAPSVSTTPLPWQASLTLIGTLPLMIVAILLSLDMVLLNGALVDSDYDRVGEVLLASVLISSLLVAARLAQQSLMKKQEA
jgi:protein-S-isoprenylcysteine O-methyltransferase Ste14